MFTTHPHSKDAKDDNATHYRDSFIEVMNEINDWLQQMWTITNI